MRIGVGWVEGPFTVPNIVDGAFKGVIPNPTAMRSADRPVADRVARHSRRDGIGKGFWSNIAVLVGIVVGAVLAAIIGKMEFGAVANAPWVGLTVPFRSGFP